MATFSNKVEDNRIILTVWVAFSGDSRDLMHVKPYYALLDTGSQGTMISQKVVKEVELIGNGVTPVSGIDGKETLTNKYRVRIDIPIASEVRLPGGQTFMDNALRGMDMDVALFLPSFKPESYDVLLGMDFLSAFHLTMWNGAYILSN